VARRLAPAQRQAAPACGGGRVSGGAALLIGVEARRDSFGTAMEASDRGFYTGKQLPDAAAQLGQSGRGAAWHRQ
jgi:hypothetical protein